ncbi:MAG: xanthine dehydrogenase family protein molybdopterin-binding subunit [Ilumatobacteraceae bacterium]
MLAPKVGQTVRSVGTPPAGVRVVELTNAAGAKVGIAAVHPRSTWDAMTAVKKITVRWNDAAFTAAIDSAAMETRRRQLLAGPTGEIVVNNGDAPGTLAATPSNRRITRTYSAPYLAHATMEVQNATALVTADGRCKVWAPTQNPTGARTIAAAVTGFTPDKIEVETTYLGGGFGRRADNEYVRQAVQVAKEMPGTPVKLVWSREEDFTHDLHRPASLATFDASVDANGALTALSTRVVCGHGKNSALEGLALRDILYTLPSNWRVEFVQDSIEVPLGFWRSVGHSQNTFFLESFLDEIAAATGKDPFTLRRELLSSDSDQHRRARAVLDRLEALSGWGSPAPSGRARGMAMTMGFGDTFVGQVAEVSGTSATSLKVHKVTVVVDPGSSINPDTVRAQMEGSVVEGLGAAWFNSVTFRSGTPVHRNFDSYRMLKMSEAPEIVTDIIESGAPMGGIGEPGLPPIAPAVANAFAKLTGNRMRSLPFASNSGGTTITPTPSITSFTPPSGPAGTVVTLTGVNFGGVTRVTFGGTTATFTAVSTTEIRATVPSRARTGTIAVTTAAGTGTSATAFTVTR